MTVTYTEFPIDETRGRLEIRGRDRVASQGFLWWFGNEVDPSVPAWHKPESSETWRRISWNLRNPLQNWSHFGLGRGGIGVFDRNYDVYGQSPAMVTDWIAVGRTGWKTSVIHLGWLRLPYVSYTGTKILWHVGWLPMGNFGLKFNRLHQGESLL